MQILEDQEQRLRLALARQEALTRVEAALPPLRRIERAERIVVGRHAEQRQERRQRGLQRSIERQQLARHLLADGRVGVARLDPK